MNLKTWCLQIWGVNNLSCLQYKNIIVDKNQRIPYFPQQCGIQCSILSKVCPLRKRLPLYCHKNSSQIFDATKLWKHTIPLTYNTKTLISNISETLRFSPQMRLIVYPDHKTTLNLCLTRAPFCTESLGSVLGPILHYIHNRSRMLSISTIIVPFHKYADDTQISQSGAPEDIGSNMTSVQECICAISRWMDSNKLMLK